MADQYQDYPRSGYRESRPSPIRRDVNDNSRDDSSDRPPRRKTGYYVPSPDECTSAMLCHLLAIFSGFIGPLIMWLVKKDESKFCDYHGRESLNFSLSLFIYNIVAVTVVTIIALVTCGIGFVLYPLLLCVPVFGLVMHIIALTSANRGEWYRYPMAIRIISAPEGLDSPPPIGAVRTRVEGAGELSPTPAYETKKGSLLWLWILAGAFLFVLLSVGCLGGLGFFVYHRANVRSTTPPALNQSQNWATNRGPADENQTPDNGPIKGRNNPQGPPNADRPDVAADPIGAALKDLQSEDRSKWLRATDSLTRRNSDSTRHDEVIAALRKLLHDGDEPVQAAAARAIAVWATTKSDIPVMLEAWKVANFVDKKRFIETFAKLKDPRTINTLIEAVKDITVRSAAEQALKRFGPEAEDEVATLLNDDNFTTRQSACNIMKEIGTKKSLPALEAAAKDKVGSVAKAAQNAIAAIKARNP